MKILVTGANGQLGRDLMNVITAGGDDAFGIDIDTVDITSREAVHDVFAGERPDAVISACHQVAAKDAPVAENNVKLNPAAFTASLDLARNSCTPLLILLLNTSGYFCQWLTAFSVERSTLELRCFHSSM